MKIAQGAEAIIYREDDRIVKDRIAKRYRHPALDTELRESRARRERKILDKARTLIPVPSVEYGDDEKVVMEFIDGPQIKKVLADNQELARRIGEQIAALHMNDIIHGDLTTSNMLYKDDTIYFIDFGLSFTSKKAEDKAVDIHLFRQALESKHHTIFDHCYRIFLKGYRAAHKDSKSCDEIMHRLKTVEARGRNKAKT